MINKLMKTSKLEDQYVVIFGLALWPEEPHEVHFFQKNVFSQKMVVVKFQKIFKIELKWFPMAPFGLIFSPNRSQCIQKAF